MAKASSKLESNQHNCSEETFSLDDVSIKFNQDDMPAREENEDTYKACRK